MTIARPVSASPIGYRVIEDAGTPPPARGRARGPASTGMLATLRKLAVGHALAVAVNGRKLETVAGSIGSLAGRVQRELPGRKFAVRQQPGGTEVWVYRIS